MLARLVRFLIRILPWLSYDYRHSRVRKRQICLACANRVRVILQFHPVEKLVIVTCPECHASWGYNPIVKTEKWMKPVTEDR